MLLIHDPTEARHQTALAYVREIANFVFRAAVGTHGVGGGDEEA